jgi:hypothetical protein
MAAHTAPLHRIEELGRSVSIRTVAVSFDSWLPALSVE